MKVAIFGSCVSRDTSEFIPNAEVITYVARQSMTSLGSPHGPDGLDLSGIDSAFQKRMVIGDLNGDGLARVVENANDLDLVLIDLIDERRGFWLFPDGTTLTNSLEVEHCGVARDARRAGARLVEFGTDEHFENWESGFKRVKRGLEDAGVWGRTVLLDIEWAAAVDGAKHPRNDVITKLGRQSRKLRRGIRDAGRDLSRGSGLGAVWMRIRDVRPTEAEDFASRAKSANRSYARYRRVARTETVFTITRSSNEVRIDRGHRWGPQPFHYRREDYSSIVDSLQAHLSNLEQ